MKKNTSLGNYLNIKSTNITLMKFIAAILVIFSHSYYIAENIMDPLAIITDDQVNIGGISVALFFFMSGLYVTKSIHSGNKTLAEYFKKRCIRIFPSLWTVVFLSILVLGTILTTETLISYFTDKRTYMYLLNGILIPSHDLPGVFEHNIYSSTVNGPLWTMPVEFCGYIVIGIVFFIGHKLHSKIISFHTIILAGLSLSTALLLYVSYININPYYVPIFRAWIFFLTGIEYFNLLGWPIQQTIISLYGGSMNLYYSFILTMPFVMLSGYLLYRTVTYHF